MFFGTESVNDWWAQTRSLSSRLKSRSRSFTSISRVLQHSLLIYSFIIYFSTRVTDLELFLSDSSSINQYSVYSKVEGQNFFESLFNPSVTVVPCYWKHIPYLQMFLYRRKNRVKETCCRTTPRHLRNGRNKTFTPLTSTGQIPVWILPSCTDLKPRILKDWTGETPVRRDRTSGKTWPTPQSNRLCGPWRAYPSTNTVRTLTPSDCLSSGGRPHLFVSHEVRNLG